jgi:hypothetical protein
MITLHWWWRQSIVACVSANVQSLVMTAAPHGAAAAPVVADNLQELKGNIRVFARVRPPSNSEMTGAEGGCGTLATEFPNSGERTISTAEDSILRSAEMDLHFIMRGVFYLHVRAVCCPPSG